jgi:hypothetical protein
MREIATLTFRDADSSEEAIAVIRAGQNRIALCLSLSSNGDVEVILTQTAARDFIAAMNQACDLAGPTVSSR